MESTTSSTEIPSKLPKEILEEIFSWLPLRDVVRTSILSTQWRYKWVSHPILKFSRQCLPAVSVVSGNHDKLIEIVNHVLLAHRGPVLKFHLYDSGNLRVIRSSEIDSWILRLLSLNSVREIYLCFSKSKPLYYFVLPCIFSFKQLTCLQLRRCKIKLPATFKGSTYLKVVIFEDVELSNETLECIDRTCTQLEILQLLNIHGVTDQIEFCNKNLVHLIISTKPGVGICLRDLPNLFSATISTVTVSHPGQQRTFFKFTDVFGNLPKIGKLDLHSLWSLPIGDVPRKLPYTCNNLQTISIQINMDDLKETLVCICLLNSSPNLKELKILLCHESHVKESATVPVFDMQVLEDQLKLKSTFNKLQIVNINDLFGLDTELVLVKYILDNSPVLKRMNIQLAKSGIEALPLLLQFKRASTRGEIMHFKLKSRQNYPRSHLLNFSY